MALPCPAFHASPVREASGRITSGTSGSLPTAAMQFSAARPGKSCTSKAVPGRALAEGAALVVVPSAFFSLQEILVTA